MLVDENEPLDRDLRYPIPLELYKILRSYPTYLVAPEKPPITQRPQGLDVCSGVPELPVFATLKAGFWQFPLMHT
ncbi:hypothetical protein EIQ13_03345, partial [Xanthomonas campestris pv. campestris]